MTCDDLTAFVDGEFSEAEAADFRRHIAGCSTCEGKLARALQMSAELADPASIAEEGTFWPGALPSPIGFSEAITHVDTPGIRRAGHGGCTVATVTAVTLVAVAVSVATSLVLLWSGVAGSVIGIAAQATGLLIGCVLLYSSDRGFRR